MEFLVYGNLKSGLFTPDVLVVEGKVEFREIIVDAGGIQSILVDADHHLMFSVIGKTIWITCGKRMLFRVAKVRVS